MYHAVVSEQANWARARLAHHWMGPELEMVRCPIRGTVLPAPIPMQLCSKVNQRVVYSWPGSCAIKITTVAFDHGSEEYYSVNLSKLCAMVLFVGPLAVRFKLGEQMDHEVLHCLVQEKVPCMAEPHLNTLTAVQVTQWFSHLVAVVAWPGASRIRTADVTISNLGLDERGGVRFFDLGSWGAVGRRQWRGKAAERKGSRATGRTEVQDERVGVRSFLVLWRSGPWERNLLEKGVAVKEGGCLRMTRPWQAPVKDRADSPSPTP